jgi:indole-3-glycerol phosphate synthase
MPYGVATLQSFVAEPLPILRVSSVANAELYEVRAHRVRWRESTLSEATGKTRTKQNQDTAALGHCLQPRTSSVVRILVYSTQSMSTRTDTILTTILATTRATVAASKALVPVAELERRAAAHHPRGWAAALRPANGDPALHRPAAGPAIIAEIKKASPSKGLIRADFDPAWLARRYRAGGAAALSVLTDEPYFQGSLRNLELASDAVPLPCLRKDFMVDEYQIVEARAHRADAILLITAALTDAELKRFAQTAHSLSLDVLVEVHTADELTRVLDVLGTGGADAIGVNNRDLRTFDVALETSLALVEHIPPEIVRVTESGLRASEDIARLRRAGFDAFLIGESFMRQPDPGVALAELLKSTAAKP